MKHGKCNDYSLNADDAKLQAKKRYTNAQRVRQMKKDTNKRISGGLGQKN